MTSITQASAVAAFGLAGLFQGAAGYCLFAHPVPYYRSKEEDPIELLGEWRRMFPPAAKMQGSIAALGILVSATASLSSGDKEVATAFGVTAACQVAIWAYSMVKLMPLNRKLLVKGGVEGDSPSKDKSKGEVVRGLLQDWGSMHAVRVVLGGVALGASAYGVTLLLK